MTLLRALLSCACFIAALHVAPAMAGHYRLVDVPDVVPAEHHKALAGAGVTNTEQLYERVARKKSRRVLSKASGVPYETLTSWAVFLDLMQVRGIGPKMVRLLNAAGIRNLRALKRSKPGPLLEAMRKANRGFRYSRVLPDTNILGQWIRRARSLPARLQ